VEATTNTFLIPHSEAAMTTAGQKSSEVEGLKAEGKTEEIGSKEGIQ